MEKLLTIKDLSARWQVGTRSIYSMAQAGKIPGALRIGKHWRFREDLIEKWIEGMTENKSLSAAKNSFEE